MIYFLLAFFIAEMVICFCIEKYKYKVTKFPILKATKNGIKFFSLKQHKINISNVKVFEFGDNVYIKTDKRIVIFKNIKNVKIKNNYMYFIGCGRVEINFDFHEFYKYFNIDIVIDNLNFSLSKQTSLLDFLNNQFNEEKSKKFQKFLKFIKNTLKIQINDKNLTVFSNNLKISYQLIYKLNNKIKRINIQNTI